MEYKKYSVEDFVLDARFRKWVLNSDPETNAFWENWLAENPQKLPLLKEARKILLSIPHVRSVLNQEEKDELWQQIFDDTFLEKEELQSDSKVVPIRSTTVLQQQEIIKPNRWNYDAIGRIAASILIFLSFLTAFLLADSPEVAAPEIAYVEKTNPWGQRSELLLSDGTKVTLNAGSSLRYAEGFNANERRVELAGEAFFHVKEDKTRPFRVVSQGITTEALGTSFNVRAYAQDSTVEVALITGKVLVEEEKHQSVILAPGERAFYGADQQLSKSVFEEKAILAWKQGVLYFKSANQEEVFSTLERWYGVKISVSNQSDRDWRYTGSFEGKNLEKVLMSIGFAMDFNFTIQDKIITITY